MRSVMTKQGVAVDYCDTCHGLWLGRGEIFHFSTNDKTVDKNLLAALKDKRPSRKLSPRSGQPMMEISYPGGPGIDFCPHSGGLWFDAGELKTLLAMEKALKIQIVPSPPPTTPRAPASGEAEPIKTSRNETIRHAKIKAGFLPLPNLFMRSVYTLTGLYSLLALVLISAVEFAGLEPELALGLGIIASLLHLILGPFFMDFWLRWVYSLRWLEPAELPAHLREFISKASKTKGINFPRMGIIDDGAPQAFTYGHVPNNARIVISRGLMEILEPEEVEAVVAHEIGHAVHWDMLLMTLAQLVPLILYYIYRSLIRMRGRGKQDKSGAYRLAIAIGAYVLYTISQYIVLWFSRTREYHADRFAGKITGHPEFLASALVKIAYGLAGQEKKKDKKEGGKRSANLDAISAMGIFDAGAARNLAAASYGTTGTTSVDKQTLKGAMRWDLWNPWAKYYEIHSTHPLVANRLRHLSDQSVKMGREPYVVFDEVQPESYWDEFVTDVGFHLLPALTLIITLLYFGGTQLSGQFNPQQLYLLAPCLLLLLGVTSLIKVLYSYRGGYFPIMSVASLLKKVKVSAVRPVPCRLKGTIIGRGVPGYIFSEDFVMRDDTGIIFLDYRQPLRIWEFFFGLLRAKRYQNQEVEVEGWYRRAPTPYIELKSFRVGGETKNCYVYYMKLFSAIAATTIGLFWLLGSL